MSRSRVSIYTQENILRLNFSHCGKRYRISLGYPDEPHFRIKAEQIAKSIELDLLADNFTGIDKYLPNKVSTNVPTPSPTQQQVTPESITAKKHNKPGYLYPHNPKRDPFTKEEIERILDALYSDTYCSKYSPVKHSFYAPFYHFMLLTAVRSAEAIGLQWKHIDFARGHIEISSVLARVDGKTSSKNRVRKLPKTGTKGIRYIPMNQQIRSLLLKIKPNNCDPDSLVFVSPRGLAIDDKNLLNRLWKPLLDKLAIPYRVPYALRHTRGTNLVESGLPINQVSYVLGHSKIKTTLDCYVAKRKPDQLPEF